MSKRPTYIGKGAYEHATKARRHRPSRVEPSEVNLERIADKIKRDRQRELAKRPQSELSKLYDEWRRM